MKEYKAIIFDFWGTLVEQGIYSPLKQIKRILGQDEMDYGEFVVIFENAMMTRKFDNLKEAFAKVCKEFGANEDVIEQLIGIWNKNWLFAKLYPDTIEALEKFKQKYKLILMANTDSISVDSVLDKFKLRAYFDKILLSYNIGCIKTNPSFFELLFDELKPEECLIIGDSIESDIITASNAGMDAILIDRRGNRDFPRKIKTLQELEWK